MSRTLYVDARIDFRPLQIILAPMFSRPAKWLVVLALVVTTGGHWVALQSIGWVSMIITYAQTDSLDVAFKKTFDGKHPCRICKGVAEGRQSEQKQASLKVETKLEFCINAQVITLPVPTVFEQETSFLPTHSSRTDSPPTPPPRHA